MSDLRNLFPCHKANRNAATPFCNTGKINPICHRTTPQKVNHANSRCSAHTDAIFTKLVSMKHKYDNENDHSNDCRDHPRPSAKTGRKADDIAVCFIPPQNTHPHGIRLPIMSCQHYTRRCAACQTRRCSICGHTGNMQKSTLWGALRKEGAPGRLLYLSLISSWKRCNHCGYAVFSLLRSARCCWKASSISSGINSWSMPTPL